MDGPGWMPGVEHIPTPTYGYADVPAGGMQPTAIVNHIAQGYQRTFDSWARLGNGIVSAHFTIGRAGRIVQYVGIFDPAYHAGLLDEGRPPSWLGYRRGVNPNKHTMAVEHEGFSIAPNYDFDYVYDAAHPWPDAMVDASIRVQRWALATARLTASAHTVIGHHEIAPRSRAHDPGPQWPRERIMRGLEGFARELSPPWSQRHVRRVIEHYYTRGGLGALSITPQPVAAGRETYLLEFS